MYTIGIRKIFYVKDVKFTLEEVQEKASAAGFSAMSFRTIIYIKEDRKTDGRIKMPWTKTVFVVSDFADQNY